MKLHELNPQRVQEPVKEDWAAALAADWAKPPVKVIKVSGQEAAAESE